MKDSAAGARRFFIFALMVLVIATALHVFANIREYIRIQAYPYQEIFYEEAITATQNSARQSAKDDKQLVPVGITVGVRFYTDGIMVLGTDKVMAKNGSHASPSDGKLMPGDMLTKINGNAIKDLPQLIAAIEAAKGEISLEINRDGNVHTVKVSPIVSAEGGRQKIGCWVRDSTQGIGTVTYYDPATGNFGALGHGITDVDTQRLMAVSHGQIMKSNILDVRKGKKGAPGELIGEICENNIMGSIKINTSLGIYGEINRNHADLPVVVFAAASHDQIRQGPAKIFSDIEGKDIKTYDVYIESVNQDARADKGLVVRITDQELIARSGGIVQGMSGSPITQGDKIVGAITHVFVQNPLRGYGVFIEKMTAEEKSSA